MSEGIMQIKAIKRNGLTDEVFYTRIMEAIFSFGHQPTADDVYDLLDALRGLELKSLSEIRNDNGKYLYGGVKLDNFDISHDITRGGIVSAQCLIGDLLEEPDQARVTLGILNHPDGKISTWLNAKKSLINSTSYKQRKMMDLKALTIEK